jgi:uncharacterized protein (TIGR02271 family)
MTRTITALYDDRAEAEAARAQLTTAGIDPASVQITSQDEGQTLSSSSSVEKHPRGFFAALKDMFMPDEDRHAYSEHISRGGYLLSARVDESRADDVCAVLEDSGAIDFDSRQAEWRESGRVGAGQAGSAAAPSLDQDTGQTIPVVEEQLRVGRREVDRGGVRVRSYVAETPVEEQIELREERVEVERRPVDQRVTGADADRLFQEQTIELSERAEEAVVGKEAVVREEMGLRKDVDAWTETVRDTVRHTEVDVDDDRRAGGRYDDDGGSIRERATFQTADDDDHSIAMDPDGDRVNETDEERRLRLFHEREPRSPGGF